MEAIHQDVGVESNVEVFLVRGVKEKGMVPSIMNVPPLYLQKEFRAMAWHILKKKTMMWQRRMIG